MAGPVVRVGIPMLSRMTVFRRVGVRPLGRADQMAGPGQRDTVGAGVAVHPDAQSEASSESF